MQSLIHKKTLWIPTMLAAAGLLSLAVGCSDEAAANANLPTANVSADQEHGHDHEDGHRHADAGHAAEDHADHAGHGHEAEDHAGDDHASDAHDGHGHAAHGEDEHGHGNDEHGHDDHGHAEHSDEVRLTDEAIARYNITVAAVQRVVPTAAFTAPARIGFNTERIAHIGSTVQGRVAQLHVRLGDQVKAGDTLMQLDSPELGRLQSDYLASLTAVRTGKPMVELAEAAYERAKKLHENGGSISLAQTQRRQQELAAASRELQTAQAQLVAAHNALLLHGMTQAQVDHLAETSQVTSRYTIAAPIAGEVIEREATLGELISPDDERLMVIADLSNVWALIDIAETRLAQVSIGSPVSLTLPALPHKRVTGKVTYISPRIDSAARTARLRVAVDNADRLLRPGMFAQASVSVNTGDAQAQRILAVPASAVMEVEGEPSVFMPVTGEANTFKRQPVKVGQRIGMHIPVLAGLSEGDRIVTAGVFILKADLGKASAKHEH